MKKVLVIAYNFPPVGGGGVQRTSKFVKYLPLYGWQPVVLTVKNPDTDYFDESLLVDLPANLIVRRTFSINLWRYYRIMKYGKNSLYEIGRNNANNAKGIRNPFRVMVSAVKGIINNTLFVPDENSSWLPFAFWEGLRLIRKEQIDLIYATGNPWTSFVIAKYLSAISKIPFVIDFRDPWVLSPYTTSDDRKTLKYWMSKKIERSCVTKASLVINVNEAITGIFKKYYKNEDKAKFVTITHGFDSNDFNGAKPRVNDKFTISHIGTFYRHRKPDKLLEAVNYIFQYHPEMRKSMEIRFVGIVGSFAEKSIRDNNLGDVVKIIPYCSHKESIIEMCSSDLLVLIQANMSGKKAEGETGKLFEYLASGRNILALTSPKNGAVGIVRNMGVGFAVAPENIELIAQAILNCYQRWKSGGSENNTIQNLSVYERRNLTGILAREFDHIYEMNKT